MTGATVSIAGTARHASVLDAPEIEKSPRALFLHFKKHSGGGSVTMTVNCYADFATSTPVFTTTVAVAYTGSTDT